MQLVVPGLPHHDKNEHRGEFENAQVVGGMSALMAVRRRKNVQNRQRMDGDIVRER